jgi:hypothetical protein
VDKRKALAEVFAMAGLLTDQSARSLREAVVRAAEAIGVPQPALTPEQFQFGSLTRALDVLRAMPPLRKPALLRILATLPRDGPSPLYRGFLAAVAAAIDCPPMRVAPGRAQPDQNGAGHPRASQMAS